MDDKAREIRRWIRSVLVKIIHYKAEHSRLIDEEVATRLKLILPQDIVMNNVLPFLALPSHTFQVEDGKDHEGEGSEEVEDESNVENEEVGDELI